MSPKKRWADDAQDSESAPPPRKAAETDSMEHQVLRLLLAGARPDLPLPVEAFWDPACRLLYRAWQEAILDEEHGGDLKAAVLHQAKGSEAAALELLARLTLAGVSSEDTEIGLSQASDEPLDAASETPAGDLGATLSDDELAQLDDLLLMVEQRYVRHENRRLRDALSEAQREGDAAAIERLVEKKLELSRRLHGSVSTNTS